MWCAGSCIFLVGCKAYLLAPELTIAEQKRIRTAQIPRITVGIERPSSSKAKQKMPVEAKVVGQLVQLTEKETNIEYAKLMINSLRDTGLFEEVDSVKRLKNPPDLVFETQTLRYGRKDESPHLITYLTLGIIPSWNRFAHTTTCKMKLPRSDSYYFLEYEQESISMFGAIPLLLKISDAWASEYSMERYFDQIVLDLVSQPEEFNRLFGKGSK